MADPLSGNKTKSGIFLVASSLASFSKLYPRFFPPKNIVPILAREFRAWVVASGVVAIASS